MTKSILAFSVDVPPVQRASLPIRTACAALFTRSRPGACARST